MGCGSCGMKYSRLRGQNLSSEALPLKVRAAKNRGIIRRKINPHTAPTPSTSVSSTNEPPPEETK